MESFWKIEQSNNFNYLNLYIDSTYVESLCIKRVLSEYITHTYANGFKYLGLYSVKVINVIKCIIQLSNSHIVSIKFMA